MLDTRIKTNKIIFSLVLFFAPLHLFSITYCQYTLYFSFLLTLFDFKFWNQIFFNLKISKSTFKFIVILFIFAFFMLLHSENIFKLFLKLLGSCIFLFYCIYGVSFYGLKILKYSFFCDFCFATIQFIEANFFKTSNFSTANLHLSFSILGQNFLFGYDGVGSYAPSISFGNWIRVSGFSAEPGYFSMTIFAGMLLFSFKKDPLIYVLLILCLLLSFSKVSFSFIIFLLMVPLIRHFALHYVFSLFFLSYCFIAYCFILYFGSLNALLSFNSSVYERFYGFYIFKSMNFIHKFIGTGFQGQCDGAVPLAILKISERGASKGIVHLGNDSLCIVSDHSFFGSFLVENGIIGIGIILLGMYIFSIKNRFSNIQQYENSKILLCGFIFSLLSLHYTTFYTMSYIILASFFSNSENLIFNLKLKKTMCHTSPLSTLFSLRTP